MNRIDRLYALVEELRAAGPRGRTARQLADHFEISIRTVERDLSALGQAGGPIRRGQGSWRYGGQVGCARGGVTVDMVSGEEISAAGLADWRKLGQGLHARYLVADFGEAARFVGAIAEVAGAAGHQPEVRVGRSFVDLKLISDDAIYRDESGVEHTVEWVTQQDLELAAEISAIAAAQSLAADPASISCIELVLDTANSAQIAPVWAALLTGGLEALGRGTISDDIRDTSGRAPILGFQKTEPHPTPRQRFHIDVQVPYDVAGQRIAAAVAAGATIVDDSRSPWTTILADPDGNKACIGTFQPAVE